MRVKVFSYQIDGANNFDVDALNQFIATLKPETFTLQWLQSGERYGTYLTCVVTYK